MSCGHCVHAVREALGSVPGVKIEEVRIGSASVSFDEEKSPSATWWMPSTTPDEASEAA
jgi:copper chaperone CopZ